METPAAAKSNSQLQLPTELTDVLFKDGYRTTQFWFALIALVLVNVGLFSGLFPSNVEQAIAALADIALPLIYQLLRNSQQGAHRDAVLAVIKSTIPDARVAGLTAMAQAMTDMKPDAPAAPATAAAAPVPGAADTKPVAVPTVMPPPVA